MSANPSNFNATVFSKMLTRRVQTQGGLMRSIARMATGDLYRATGKYSLIQGGGLPTKITTRNPLTPNSEADYTLRSVSRDDYHDSQTLDRGDLDRMQVDPRYDKWDIVTQKFSCLEDFIYQSSALGAALGGATGTTSTAFDTNNVVSVALGAASGYTNAGFTYEKLKAGIKRLGKNNVNLSKGVCCVISYDQWDDMMGQDKFINSDFSNAHMIDRSSPTILPPYMGVQFVITNILPYMTTAGTGANVSLDTDITAGTDVWADTDSTDIRACILTVKGSTLLEIKPDAMVRGGENPSISYREQIYMEMGIGGVRMQEEEVVIIPADQSPVLA